MTIVERDLRTEAEPTEFHGIRFAQYLPGRVVTNEDLEREGITTKSGKALTAERMERITGIVERRVAYPHETALYMAERVFEDVLGDSAPEVILTSTSYPEASEGYPDGVNFSNHLKQMCVDRGLDGEDIHIMDVYAACSGFARQLKYIFDNIDEFDGRDVVLVNTERYSDTLDNFERQTFTDRATAMRFRVNRDLYIDDVLTKTRDDFDEATNSLILMPIDRSKMVEPYIEEEVDVPDEENGHDPRYFYQDGPGVKLAVLATLPDLVRKLDDEYVPPIDEDAPLKKLIPHQGSKQIVDREIARALPEYEVIRDYAEGNGSSTSIPRAFMRLVQEGRVFPGEELVMVGFGAGMHITAVKVRIGGAEIVSLEPEYEVAEAA